MFGLSRLARLFLILLVVIILPSLYFFYPNHDIPRSPAEEVYEYDAGGIDSDHWRAPVKPNFEKEEVRWSEDEELALNVEDGGGGDGGDSGKEKAPQSNSKHVAVDTEAHSASGVGLGLGIHESVLSGGVIMPKLGNATAKAELGRAAWRVLHLMTLRYPDTPTDDDRQALKSYFHLFSRLYPCGECATEFQKLLKEYPPQTSSRKAASMWLCHVHNLVNERLGKEEFDCLTLDEKYDCGCGPEATGTETETGTATGTAKGVETQAAISKEKPKGTSEPSGAELEVDDDWRRRTEVDSEATVDR